MADTRNYDYTPLMDKRIKPEESLLNPYVDECFESENMINPTRRMLRILDAKYEKDDLNKVMTKQYQHLSTE